MEKSDDLFDLFGQFASPAPAPAPALIILPEKDIHSIGRKRLINWFRHFMIENGLSINKTCRTYGAKTYTFDNLVEKEGFMLYIVEYTKRLNNFEFSNYEQTWDSLDVLNNIKNGNFNYLNQASYQYDGNGNDGNDLCRLREIERTQFIFTLAGHWDDPYPTDKSKKENLDYITSQLTRWEQTVWKRSNNTQIWQHNMKLTKTEKADFIAQEKQMIINFADDAYYANMISKYKIPDVIEIPDAPEIIKILIAQLDESNNEKHTLEHENLLLKNRVQEHFSAICKYKKEKKALELRLENINPRTIVREDEEIAYPQ